MNSQKFFATDSSWIEVYESYLNQCDQQDHQKSVVNGIKKNSSTVDRQRFIKESHDVLFSHAFNAIEAKRPVQSVYKRPI